MFWKFSVIFLLLISSLSPLWARNIFCVISVVLNLWRFISWPRIWTILVSLPWALKKRILGSCLKCSMIIDYNLLVGSVAEFLYILLIFSLVVWLLVEEGILKSPSIMMNLSISLPFLSIFVSHVLQISSLALTHLGLRWLLPGRSWYVDRLCTWYFSLL